MSKSKPVFFTRFDPPPDPVLDCKDASLTRQEFVVDADLNNIMRKYASGLPPSSPGARPPMFGDFSNVPDYQTCLEHVMDAQERFAQLPSDVRRRFDNDPGKLLQFVADKSNRDEAISLGLIDKPAVEPVSVPDKGAE